MERPFPGGGLSPLSLSALTFSWFGGRVSLGQRRALKLEDTIPLPPHFTASAVHEAFTARLRAAVAASAACAESGVPDAGCLWRALHSLIFYNFWAAGLCRLVNDALVLLGPVCVGGIIRAAAAGDRQLTACYATLLCAAYFGQALFLQQFINLCFNCGQQAVSAATCAVFRSALARRPGQEQGQERTAGELYNIQSKDAASLREFVVFAHNLWACPLLAAGAVLLLFSILGEAVCYAVLCCAMLCYVVLCCAMLCYAMLCYAVLCYALAEKI
jgi:hypothetical protein